MSKGSADPWPVQSFVCIGVSRGCKHSGRGTLLVEVHHVHVCVALGMPNVHNRERWERHHAERADSQSASSAGLQGVYGWNHDGS